MRPALDWIVPTIPPGKGLGASQREKRIDCGVALSPQGVGEPFFISESFGGLQVPLLGISGTLDKQLEIASIYFDRELESRIKKFTAMFEPLMIVAVGVVVGFVAVALVQAMYGVLGGVKNDGG